MSPWAKARRAPAPQPDSRRRLAEDAVALDGDAILARFGDDLAAWAGFRPAECTPHLIKRSDRHLVVRYALSHPTRSVELVGKWYTTGRGRLVYDLLRHLQASGFGGSDVAVPAPIVYAPDLRVLFTEFVGGQVLREALHTDHGAAYRAGTWLATFHNAPPHSPRDVGPSKQLRAARRWSKDVPLGADGEKLEAALAHLANPRRPVHYDYYHSQLLLGPNPQITAVDLDESGLGDPAWDLAHFEAHLELLALQWHGDPQAFRPARTAFRDGYRAIASLPEQSPALAAHAWFKLAHQLEARGRPASERAYARLALARVLSIA